jgi:hypothetical protein
MRRLFAPLVVALTVACHNGGVAFPPTGSAGSPTGPNGLPSGSPGSASAITLVSGETGLPVAGARVSMSGQAYTSDPAGLVFLSGMSSELDIQATGYLERQTALSANSQLLTLWPRLSPTGLDEEGTARIVYGCGATGCATGAEVLSRLPRGAAVLVPSREIQADPGAMQALEEGARRLSENTLGNVTIELATGPRAGAASVTVSVDPHDPVILALGAGAVTRRELSGASEIVRASVAFRSLDLVRRLPLVQHELGHVFGLAHSGRASDIMWPGPEIYSLDDYSARERLAIGLMLQRVPGNRLPDDDRSALTARATAPPRRWVIACPSP